MRRIVFLFIALILIISLFSNTLIVSATENNSQLESNEAKRLIFEAWYLCSILRYSDISYLDENGNQIEYNNAGFSEYYLCDETKLPGGSYDKMKEYAESIYSEDIALRSYSKLYSDTSVDMFLFDDGLFWCSDRHHNKTGTDDIVIPRFYLSCGKYTRNYDFVNMSYNLSEAASEITLEIIQSSETEATARVMLEYNPRGFADAYIYPLTCWVDCEFTKTSDGWRISGGNYVNALNDAFSTTYTNISSPSTADPAFDSIVFLPVISLACLTPAFYLFRRRRRN